MEKMGFERYGFQTIFGFTHSIFIRHIPASSAVTNTTTIDSFKRYIDKFLENCQHQLKDQIQHKNKFMFTIIFDKNDHYIA
jgi:hypothetical protein